MPMAQISTGKLCPKFYKVSGERYPGVPHMVYVRSVGFFNLFEKPKSTSFTWPSSSNKMFSGFKSL
jgi:hypothetical protein